MFGRKNFRGGAHPPENKHLTKNKPISAGPLPQRVVIPLAQHTGAPCRPLPAVGDEVKEGQKIGESAGFISACVHSSISGTVTAVETRPHPVLPFPATAIVVESKNPPAAPAAWPEKPDWRGLPAEAIKEKIKEAGIVGLGGAAFPTHVKLAPPANKKVEILVLNGAECEPYLTADHRLMLEKSDGIIEGLFLLLKALSIKKAVIGIEENKADAIRLFNEKLSPKLASLGADYSVRVVPLRVKYPQGAEKQLIKTLVDKEVPSGGLPFDVGAVVQNVGTAYAVYEAVAKDKPLIERVVTVSGDAVAEPANLLVRIGTTFRDLLNAVGGITSGGAAHKVIMGGPMMGLAQYNLETPVIKGTSGLLVLKENGAKPARPCVKCGGCVDHCPMGLMPYRLGDLAERDDFQGCAETNIKDCIECGVCAYICASARPLVHLIKYAKQSLAKQKK